MSGQRFTAEVTLLPSRTLTHWELVVRDCQRMPLAPARLVHSLRSALRAAGELVVAHCALPAGSFTVEAVPQDFSAELMERARAIGPIYFRSGRNKALYDAAVAERWEVLSILRGKGLSNGDIGILVGLTEARVQQIFSRSKAGKAQT